MGIVVVQHGQGGVDVLRVETREVGEPSAGQLRLEQRAIGFNYLDVLQRNGVLSLNAPERIMGIEGAGVVTAVGSGVADFAVGDRVGYLRSQGAYASERLIGADELIHLPDDVTFDQAAAFIVKGFMAWFAACHVFEVRAGQTVIVTTAAGRIGSLTVRLATFLGARVIAVVGTPAKRDTALANGAVEQP